MPTSFERSARRFLILGIIVVAGAAEVSAQCALAKQLGGAENFRRHPRIKIETGSFPNDGNELGSIWAVGAPAFNSGGAHFDGEDRCPSSGTHGWWKTGTKFLGQDSGIQAYIGSTPCLFTNCPPAGRSLITILEDRSADGSDAAFIAYMVDESPATRRWYDHSRTEPMGTGRVTTHKLPAFPVPVIVDDGSSRGPALRLDHVGGHVHAVNGPENARLDDGEAIRSFEIVSSTSAADPGRFRSRWATVKSMPSADAGQTIELGDEICGTTQGKLWLAVGVTFVDEIESRLVGRAVRVDCSNVGRRDAE